MGAQNNVIDDAQHMPIIECIRQQVVLRSRICMPQEIGVEYAVQPNSEGKQCLTFLAHFSISFTIFVVHAWEHDTLDNVTVYSVHGVLLRVLAPQATAASAKLAP